MTPGADPDVWQWLVQNLWLPILSLVGALVTVVRYADVRRIDVLETKMDKTATKDDILRVELLAERAVQQERFAEYIVRVDEARKESRDLLANVMLEIKETQRRTEDKLGALTERVLAYGLIRDERTTTRAPVPDKR